MPITKIIQITKEQAFDKSLQSPLRVDCEHVELASPTVARVIECLRSTLHNDPITVGLAAPQIGETVRICVINISKGKQEQDIVLINPEITPAREEQVEGFESCMSIPDWRGKVRRFTEINVRYTTPSGEIVNEVATGFKARVLQHEVDHLNGVLFTDYLDDPALLEETDLFKK